MTTKILPPNLVSDTKPTEQFRITAKEKVQALKEDPLVERIKALENEIQRLKGINAKLTQEYSLLKDENNRLIKQCGTLTNLNPHLNYNYQRSPSSRWLQGIVGVEIM